MVEGLTVQAAAVFDELFVQTTGALDDVHLYSVGAGSQLALRFTSSPTTIFKLGNAAILQMGTGIVLLFF